MNHHRLCKDCKLFERYWQEEEERRKRIKNPDWCSKYLCHDGACPKQNEIDKEIPINHDNTIETITKHGDNNV